jgi:hypothetical protein
MENPMFDAVQIPLENLQMGRWYVGRGRNGNVGLWNGDSFLVISKQGVQVSATPRVWETVWAIKQEPYFTDADGCFQPFAAIDEGVITESFSELEIRYAKKLRFGDGT